MSYLENLTITIIGRAGEELSKKLADSVTNGGGIFDQGWAFGQNFFLCPTDGRAEVKNFWLVRPKAEPSRIVQLSENRLGSPLGSAPEHFFGQIRTPDSRAPETLGTLF